MLNFNLMNLPTLREIYDRLDAIPVVLVPSRQNVPGGGSAVTFDVKHRYDLKSIEDDSSMGLISFVRGNLITAGVVDPEKVGGTEKHPFLLATVQGDNSFAVKVTKEVSKEDNTVTLTTSIMGAAAGVQGDETNTTEIRQVFRPFGQNLESYPLRSEILATGFNRLGPSIPVFAGANVLGGYLQRLYMTSEYARNLEQPEYLIIQDGYMAIWDSWGDGIKAVLTVTGGIVGGIVGAATGPGAIGTAAAGAALGGALGDILI